MSQGLNKVIGFLFLPFISRIMTLTDFGSYGQVILVGNIGSRLFSFGLATVIFVFYARNVNNEHQVFRSNTIAILLVGISASIIGYCFAPNIASVLGNESIVEILRLYVWIIPLSLLSTSFDSTLIFFNKVKESAILLVVVNLISLALIAIALIWFYSLESLFIAIVLGHLTKFVILLFFIPKFLWKKCSLDLKMIKSQLWIGLPLGLTMILGYLFKYTDGLMISNMLGTDEYAIYRNGAIELPFVAAFYSAITKIVLPDVSKYYANNQFLSIVDLKRKIINYNSLIIFPIALYLVFFSSPLITLYLSEKYSASAGVFSIYTLLLLIRVNNYGDIFTAANRNIEQVVIYSIIIVVNIPLNYYFITLWGKQGAAIATLLAFFILVVMLLSRATGLLKVQFHQFIDFKFVGIILGVSMLLSWLGATIYSYFDSWPIFFLISMFYFLLIGGIYFGFKLVPIEFLNILYSKLNIRNSLLIKIKKCYNV